MPLTHKDIENAKPGETLKKLSDGGGLQLWIFPKVADRADRAKSWRLAYRFDGKQKSLTFGAFPAVSLKEARERREAAKRLLAEGRDPSAVKKLAKAAKAVSSATTFDAIAAELLDKKQREGKAGGTMEKVEWLLSFAKPEIGPLPIAEITAPQILAILRNVEARGRHETARRLRATIGQVFRYAVSTGRADTDPTFALKGALIAPTVQNRAAIVEPKAFGGLLRAIAGYQGAPETRAALELLALTFVRPGEMRSAEWSEFDVDAAVWSIPASKMKMRRGHRVPLAPQAVDLLRELKTLTGHGRFLFPSVRSAARCMSENTVNASLRRLGFGKNDMTGHGFRSSASTMLNESGKWNADAIEAQLAHVDADSVRRAYARAEYWEERVKMMAWWADRCDEMRTEKPT